MKFKSPRLLLIRTSGTSRVEHCLFASTVPLALDQMFWNTSIWRWDRRVTIFIFVILSLISNYSCQFEVKVMSNFQFWIQNYSRNVSVVLSGSSFEVVKFEVSGVKFETECRSVCEVCGVETKNNFSECSSKSEI